MLEQYKVDALREALHWFIGDHCRATEDEGVLIDIKDHHIRQFVENLEGIIGKEHKEHSAK